MEFDAVIVGSGPNGMAAAAVLSEAGLSVLVLEAHRALGGGCRTSELTEPGFHHDVCSAIHPLGAGSPYFRTLPLEQYGLHWAHPKLPLAHPFDDGSAAVLYRSLEQTAKELGADARAYEKLMRPFVDRWPVLLDEVLKPLRVPRRPRLMARFGLCALRSCDGAVQAWFRTDAARALFGGSAAHSVSGLDRAGTAAFGLMLNIAGHAVGWPCAAGGSGRIVSALKTYLSERGVTFRTDFPVRSLQEVPSSRAVLFDTGPRQLAQIAGDALPRSYRAQLDRYERGPGVFKVDWALDEPIPWKNELTRGAGTVHVVGSYAELQRAELSVARGEVPERPFVLAAQQSLFDSRRAPSGKHTGWAYCHVPNGCPADMTEAIESQIERFAPGFRDVIRARVTMGPADYQRYNASFAGGDITGGANTLRQLLFRPAVRWNPYATPNPRLFIGSSSTPPGGGVHGMCGYWAARTILRQRF